MGSDRPATSPHSMSTPRAAAAAMHAIPTPSISTTWSFARRGSRPHTAHPAIHAASTATSRGNPGASPCTTDAASIVPIISPGNASRRPGAAASPDEPGFANHRTSVRTRGRVAEARNADPRPAGTPGPDRGAGRRRAARRTRAGTPGPGGGAGRRRATRRTPRRDPRSGRRCRPKTRDTARAADKCATGAGTE